MLLKKALNNYLIKHFNVLFLHDANNNWLITTTTFTNCM